MARVFNPNPHSNSTGLRARIQRRSVAARAGRPRKRGTHVASNEFADDAAGRGPRYARQRCGEFDGRALCSPCLRRRAWRLPTPGAGGGGGGAVCGRDAPRIPPAPRTQPAMSSPMANCSRCRGVADSTVGWCSASATPPSSRRSVLFTQRGSLPDGELLARPARTGVRRGHRGEARTLRQVRRQGNRSATTAK